MKNIFKYIFVAASVVAFAACNKAENELQNEEGFYYTFTLGNPATKSVLASDSNGKFGQWESGDQIGTAIDDETPGYAKINVATSTDPATFKIYRSGGLVEGMTLCTYYPQKNATSKTAVPFEIPVAQSQSGDVFDFDAMPMVGEPYVIPAVYESSNSNTNIGEIHLANLASVIDFQVYSSNATYASEKIKSVTLSANKAIAGSFSKDISAVQFSDESTLTISGYSETAVTNTVTNAVAIGATRNEASHVYMVIAPETGVTGSVVVITDLATYTFNITTAQQFKRGGLKSFGLNLANCGDRDAKPIVNYSLYDGPLTEGDYIIFDATDGHALKAEVSDKNRFNYEEVTPVADVISTCDESILWHIAASSTYYTIYNVAVGKYAAATNSKNTGQLIADGTDDKALWTLEGTYDFINKDREASSSDPNNKYLRSNGASGFACYASGTGHTLQLYKVDTRVKLPAPASVTAALNSTDDTVIDVTFSSVTGAASYVIVATPTAGSAITKDVTSSPATISVADGLTYNTAYTISVYAIPSDLAANKNSDPTSASGSVTTGDAPTGYVLVGTTSDVTTGLYIIAAKVNDKYYAMSNTFASKIDGTEITVTAGTISTTNAADYSVTIVKSSGEYTIKNASNEYLGWVSSTNFNTGGSNNKWTVSDGVKGTFRFTNVGSTSTSTTRVIAYNGTQFGPYAASNVTSTGSYYDVELFKYNGTVTIKSDPTTTVTPASPIALNVGNTQPLTVNTDSDGTVSFESSNDAIASVSATGVITANAAGTATITVSITETSDFNADSKEITVNVSAGTSTIAQVLAGGTGTYSLANLLVYAVNGKNAIVGDSTGKMLLFMTNTLSVGDIINISGATVSVYDTTLEITAGSISTSSTGNAVDHGSATNLNDSAVASSAYSTFSATGYHSAIYVSMSGSQSARNITGSNPNTTLYLNVANSTYDGKHVNVTGYIYSWSTSHTNYNFQLLSIEEDTTVPSIKVSPTSLNWSATEYGNTNSKTITVTLNGAAAAGDYTMSGSSTDWTVSDNGSGTITVYPKAENSSTTDDKSLTLTFAHKDDSSVSEQVTLTQAKASSGTGGTLTLDFESDTYSDWTLTTIKPKQTDSGVSAHGGSYFGSTDGKESGSIVTTNKIAHPGTLTFFISKLSTNTNASSVWRVSVSSDGTSWTKVGDDQAAASGITKGTWKEVTRDLSSYSDVYVKIEYSGTSAKRCIDDISLTYE